MSCHCPVCAWPIHTEHPIRIKCFQCSTIVECGEGGLTTVGMLPVALEHWPVWALAIKRLRKDSDTGVGDTVQRVAAWFGGEYFKSFAARIGIPCGCSSRQSEWNQLYPYEG